MVGSRDGTIKLYINNGTPTNPVLNYNGFIKANNSTIDVGSNSCPVMIDWDNDGKKDLIIGNESYEVRVYLNTGSNDSPTFGSYTKVANVSHYRSHPEVYDLNRDGKKDLIVGDSNGDIFFHENFGTDASPSFGPGEQLKLDNGNDLQVYYGGHVDAYDWDGDGFMDLLIGDYYSYVNIFINTEISSMNGEPDETMPADFALHQNYPNPFNPQTTIRYRIAKANNVTIDIIDVSGKVVSRLVEAYQTPGSYSVNWNAADLPSGIYFYRLSAGAFVDVKKCMLVK